MIIRHTLNSGSLKPETELEALGAEVAEVGRDDRDILLLTELLADEGDLAVELGATDGETDLTLGETW